MPNLNNSLSELTEVPPSTAKQYILDCLQAGIVPFVTGSPGIGKSQIIKEIADEMNWKVIDHRLSTSDVTDLLGLPHFVKKSNGKEVATFAPFDIFPTELDQVPDGYNGWLLFLDEFNSAPEEVQAAAYKLVLDRMVGQYQLNDRCLIVCAGNGKNDKAIVNDLSTAMVSRLVHIHMKTSFDDWRENVAFKQNYDSRIIAFLTAYPNKLMDFEPENEEKEGKPFCCPRSWEFINRILKVPNFKLDFNTQALLQGTISNDVAIQFTAFCKAADEMETLENIINHPTTAKVPSKTDTKWFTIVSLLQNFEESYLSSFEQYLTRFNDLSFEVLFYRALLAQTPEIAQNTLFQHKLQQITEYQRKQREKNKATRKF